MNARVDMKVNQAEPAIVRRKEERCRADLPPIPVVLDRGEGSWPVGRRRQALS